MPLVADRKRDYEANYSRERNVTAAAIEAPPARNQERWEKYRLDLFSFLTECFPESTGIDPFSDEHRRVIERTQQAILTGGQELFVVFRGFAKTTITENSAIWAAGYGHRRFFLPIGSTDEMAKASLDSIQSEFETNRHLMEVFPEVCHCAQALEGIAQRTRTQHIGGQKTRMVWDGERCVLPTIDGFPGSGAIIWPKGITANGIRGIKFKRPDGNQQRPDFVMVDDPQTDDSAASPAQVNKRLKKLKNTILRLGGHKTSMACVINATIIEADDMVDRLTKEKAWRTVKVPMLKSFSTVQDTFWLGTYAETRLNHNQDDDDDKSRAHLEATELYRTKQAEADAGAIATWQYCFDKENEISSIQHAYNIMVDTGEDAFMAECQNTPFRDTGGLEMLTPDEICQKMSGYLRGQFPEECTVLTTKIDVHPSILYWEEWAWEPDTFTGYCIDYGTFPDQRRTYFSHNALSRRLQDLFPGRDVDATVTAGLEALIEGSGQENWPGLLRRERLRGDGQPMKIGRGAIDANGEASNAVKRYIRQSEFSSILSPSYGRGVTAKQKPISQWQQSIGRKNMGPEWVLTKGKPGEPAGEVFDTNYWKTRFHRALSLPNGSRGALYLFKAANPQIHRRVADHWVSEKPTEVSAGSRIVYEWTQKPGTDNHDFDVAVGNMVEASRSGVTNVRTGAKKVERLSLAELQKHAKVK